MPVGVVFLIQNCHPICEAAAASHGCDYMTDGNRFT